MKYNKRQFETSTRLQNYEIEVLDILKFNDTYKIEDLQKQFKGRASLSTIKSIVNHSENLTANNNIVSLLGLHASISYTISGNNISGVFLGGRSGGTSVGIVHGVSMNMNYSFKLMVISNGGNWKFNTTSILVNDGAERKLTEAKESSNTQEIINTVTS
tara:strand:+ start:79 stop:555 length:477 start_codon:yes stop_codon:yes gene_type:complete